MKKIAIEVNYLNYVILDASEFAAIVPALCRLKFYEKKGYSDDAKFTRVKDAVPTILFVPESQIEETLPEMMENAQHIDPLTLAPKT